MKHLNLQIASIKKPKTLIRRLIRLLLFSFLGLVIILIALSGYFYLNRDTIGRKLLLTTNKLTPGELSFREITFNPFVQFPSISLTLEDVEYYETPEIQRDSSEIPIAQLEYIHGAIDILDLLNEEINISKILIDNGSIHMIRYSDSTFNILNAFRFPEEDTILASLLCNDPHILMASIFKETPDDSIVKTSQIALSLKQITVRDLAVDFTDHISNLKSEIEINTLKASLRYLPDTVECDLTLNTEIKSAHITDKWSLQDKNIYIETAFLLNREDQIIKVEPSLLKLDNTEFDLQGSLGFSDNYFIDMEIDGSDKDIQFLNLFLSKTGIDNLKSGDVYFSSTIKGNWESGLPEIKGYFGIRDLTISIPNTDHSINKLNIEGFFNAGDQKDFSKAYIRIDTLNGQLPGGYVKGKFEFRNLVAPYIHYTLDLKTNLDGFEQIFNLEVIDSIHGSLTFNNRFEGQFHQDIGWDIKKENKIHIEFDSISFVIPQVMAIDHLNGKLDGNLTELHLHDLFVKTGNTDLLINGNLYHIKELMVDLGQEISAELEIKSALYDQPKFLSFVPQVGKSFPYRLRDVDLDVRISTDNQKLIEFNIVPEIYFNINHLELTIDEFLPPISLENGLFTLHEIDSNLHLDFRDLDIKIADGYLNANVELYFPRDSTDYLKIYARTENLNPGKLFYLNPSDTIPAFLDANLTGVFNCDLYFPFDTTSVFSKVEFTSGDLSYQTQKDTVETDSLTLTVLDLDFSFQGKGNPLANLSTGITIKAKKFYTNHFKVEDIQYQINAVDGTYTIIPEKSKLFGKRGTGRYVISPFAHPPTYHLNYAVDQFQIKDLLTSFLGDTLITGLMDFDMEVDFSGDSLKAILNSMRGRISLKGKDLILNGIDIDELLDKFKRSQRFNLVDVGAFMFAGPVGLAITKGSDYRSLLIANKGEYSAVREMVSQWDIEEGILKISDVAFATETNRIAAEGWVNVTTDSLDISMAILNDKGCSILTQDIYGHIKNPETGDIKIIASILAPVTNLVQSTLGIDCDPFYTGSISHPPKQ